MSPLSILVFSLVIQAGAKGDATCEVESHIIVGISSSSVPQVSNLALIRRFQLECRVLDEGRVLGVGRTDLDVVDKGRFFDQPGFRRK